MDALPLDGRVALVTGGSRGIGAAIARRLARAGAHVVVAARSTEPKPGLAGTIGEVAAAIEAEGGSATAMPVDLARADERERLVERVESELGFVDVLVNNAAASFYADTVELPLPAFDYLAEVNLRAVLHLIQLVVPPMRESGGAIVNVSSRAAHHPPGPPYTLPKHVPTLYGALKAALDRLTTGLAAELHDDGIRVNAVGPARLVPTPGAQFHGLDRPEARTRSEVESPDVMAEAVLALASGEPVPLTGRVVLSQELLAELGIAVEPEAAAAPGDARPR